MPMEDKTETSAVPTEEAGAAGAVAGELARLVPDHNGDSEEKVRDKRASKKRTFEVFPESAGLDWKIKRSHKPFFNYSPQSVNQLVSKGIRSLQHGLGAYLVLSAGHQPRTAKAAQDNYLFAKHRTRTFRAGRAKHVPDYNKGQGSHIFSILGLKMPES